MDFRRSAGWWRGVSASPISSEPDNGWKPLVSLTDRASCSCFVRLCVSEERFVTSGLLAYTWGRKEGEHGRGAKGAFHGYLALHGGRPLSKVA
jgi:hypothetical protein